MQARVKPDHRWNTVMAFSGHEYIKGEWREVPADNEAEAERHPHLETQAETKRTKKKTESK